MTTSTVRLARPPRVRRTRRARRTSRCAHARTAALQMIFTVCQSLSVFSLSLSLSLSLSRFLFSICLSDSHCLQICLSLNLSSFCLSVSDSMSVISATCHFSELRLKNDRRKNVHFSDLDFDPMRRASTSFSPVFGGRDRQRMKGEGKGEWGQSPNR